MKEILLDFCLNNTPLNTVEKQLKKGNQSPSVTKAIKN